MRALSYIRLRAFGAVLAGLLHPAISAQQTVPTPYSATLEWDQTTLTLIQPDGVYGRIVRLADNSLLCAYEWGGSVYVRQSVDEGATWKDPIRVAHFRFGTATNPEVLVLHDGSIMLSYNERPTDGVHSFSIRVCFSRDNGKTWTDHSLLYQAGASFDTGCWEPAQVQLPWGEINLFFSNEKPYTRTSEQEITVLRSFDGGASWGEPERASFRPGHRDGMAVHLILNGSAEVILAIEDDGLIGAFKPVVVAAKRSHPGKELLVDATAPRWPALEMGLPASVYAGAPYIRQFPSGETILSVQSGQNRSKPGTLEFSRMVVYVGDGQARNFVNPTEPFSVAPDSNGLWNSLFIKNGGTVTAISTTTIDGIRGLWSIDGRLKHAPRSNEDRPEEPSPARQRAHSAGRKR